MTDGFLSQLVSLNRWQTRKIAEACKPKTTSRNRSARKIMIFPDVDSLMRLVDGVLVEVDEK